MNFFDRDLELIARLLRLQILKIVYITAAGLADMSNLKDLDGRGCINLEDDGRINLLKCAANLEILDFTDCKKITISVVNVAIEMTKNRTNNILIEISVGRTKINVNKIKKKSPLLNLSTY